MNKHFWVQWVLLIGLLYNSSPSVAQTPSNYQPTKVIPPSPTAASLGVYGDLTVGYYSGNPNITVPIYNIQTPSHTLDIRISYNASGIRVTENASWVGLGWSLSAGGVITRTARGMDDFEYQGFYTAAALPLATSGNTHDVNSPNRVAEQAYYDNIVDGKIDGDPDIFSYNFSGNAGKLVLGKKANGSPIFIADRNALKVAYNQTLSQWLITDLNGYAYYFGTFESTTEEYTYSSPAIQIADQAPLSQFTYSPLNRPITTAWYLDSIVSPTAETIRFFYVHKGHSFSLINASEKAYDQYAQYGNCDNHTPSFKGTYRFYSATKSTISDVYLDSIAYSNGSVKFTATDRADIEAVAPGKPAKLSTITIRDKGGETAEEIRIRVQLFQ